MACNTFNSKLSKYGTSNQIVMDAPVRGKPVGLKIIRQRYKCNGCNRTFREKLPDIDEKRAVTKRLIQFIHEQALERPFSNIANEVGIDEKSVRNIFREYIETLEKDHETVMPRWLGIDEIHILSKPRALLTNIEVRTIVDFLPSRKKEILQDYFKIKGDKHNIEFVTMDMWNPYRSLIKEETNARIIVDKFHVVRMANNCLDVVRKSIRDNLTTNERRKLKDDRFLLLKHQSELSAKQKNIINAWMTAFPVLYNAYIAKESFYEIFDSCDRNQATERYRQWLGSLDDEIKDNFKPLTTAMNNWYEEIMNYFDKPLTNAYTESLNNIIRSINRNGRGYSFDVLRAKILFAKGAQRRTRGTFQKQQSRPESLKMNQLKT